MARLKPCPFKATTFRCRRDRGAMLLAVLFMMAIMVISALAVAPAFLQQAKRDREEEMIHRGTEYARAVKKYYKKFGRYPANLEQLENTNQIRFLRRRYKDPLAKDGQWKLLRAGDIQSLVGGAGFGAQGLQPGVQGGLQGQNPFNSGPAGGAGSTASTVTIKVRARRQWGRSCLRNSKRHSWRARQLPGNRRLARLRSRAEAAEAQDNRGSLSVPIRRRLALAPRGGKRRARE